MPKNSSGTAGGTFFEALTNTTYYTVGNSFAEAWSLSADGGLESMISNVSFPSPSFTHGIYVGRTEEYAYIPDIDANEVSDDMQAGHLRAMLTRLLDPCLGRRSERHHCIRVQCGRAIQRRGPSAHGV